MDYCLKSHRVMYGGKIEAAQVQIENGRIAGILPYDASFSGTVEDLGNQLVMAGLVDCHVHINEPGRTEWEGFTTATQAAAAGGITGLVDMPLNCMPVTTTVDALAVKLQALGQQLSVDCGFWGGVVPDNINQLPALLDAGVLGVKCFLIHSGIDDFPNVTEAQLRQAMPLIAQSGKPLLVHAELDLSGNNGQLPIPNHRHYQDFLDSRPGRWEQDAIELMIRLCRETGCRVHIVHLSCADALPAIRAAKAEGLPLTVETCSHYLTLHAEDVPEGNTRYKCAPPIREKANADRLWAALADGTLDFVVSDHSPCTPELKRLDQGDFAGAWGGISSVQFGLPVVWTEARRRGFGLTDVSRWMSAGPAAFTGLNGNKGSLAPGMDADLVIWDPDEHFFLTADLIRYKNRLSPYEGFELQGVVKRTILRGETVFLTGQPPLPTRGRAILHGKTALPVSVAQGMHG